MRGVWYYAQTRSYANGGKASSVPEPTKKTKMRNEGKTNHGVPRTCAQTDGVVAHSQAADSVIVALKRADMLATEDIEDLAIV